MTFDLLFTLKRYYRAYPDIFDWLELPDGVDKSALIGTIVRECGDFGVSPDISNFKEEVNIWGQTRAYTIKTLWESVNAEYNPIENYDRYEDLTDDTSGHADITNKSAGYNETTLKTDSGGTTQSFGTVHHHAHIHGNIGVTTAGQMLTEHRKVAMFNVYKQIAHIFADDLLIKIYF